MPRHGLLALALAALLLFFVLIQPNHPHAVGWRALFVFPLELPVVLLAMVALPQASIVSRVVRVFLVSMLTLVAVLKAADFVSFNALSRGFNPVSDLTLVHAFARLLSGTFGFAGGLALAGLAIILVAVLAAGLWWATGVWSHIARPLRVRLFAGGAAVLFAVLMVLQIGFAMGRWSPPFDPPGTAFTARMGVERWEMVGTTLDELQRFRTLASQDIFADRQVQLGAIDRDVIVIFVESYGRTSHDTPLFADLHRATLAAYEQQMREAGFAMRSGFLQAPTRGGQSWLSHASVANGLWIDNQMSYAAALASGRETLYHHAASAGFHTATVMPQITLDWPESDVMGFETVLTFDDLGYQGPALNWVAMPDQFTLMALDRLVRTKSQDQRNFVQVALASSHAPWVPVPDFLPWDTVEGGQVYATYMEDADSPREVWRDLDRVRAQYRLAVDYALTTVFEYALLHADEPPLLLVLGDHQAAEFVALDDRPHVPIHVIGPAELVDPLETIAPAPGLLPPEETSVLPMSRVRDAFLTTFSATDGARIGQ